MTCDACARAREVAVSAAAATTTTTTTHGAVCTHALSLPRSQAPVAAGEALAVAARVTALQLLARRQTVTQARSVAFHSRDKQADGRCPSRRDRHDGRCVHVQLSCGGALVGAVSSRGHAHWHAVRVPVCSNPRSDGCVSSAERARPERRQAGGGRVAEALRRRSAGPGQRRPGVQPVPVAPAATVAPVACVHEQEGRVGQQCAGFGAGDAAVQRERHTNGYVVDSCSCTT